jgi:hypothetical protein
LIEHWLCEGWFCLWFNDEHWSDPLSQTSKIADDDSIGSVTNTAIDYE